MIQVLRCPGGHQRGILQSSTTPGLTCSSPKQVLGDGWGARWARGDHKGNSVEGAEQFHPKPGWLLGEDSARQDFTG